MEGNQKQQYQSEKGPHHAAHEVGEELGDGAPEVPVVRTNTPRPLSVESMLSQSGQLGSKAPFQKPFNLPNFPSMAPVAPPLPEEVDERDDGPAMPAPAVSPVSPVSSALSAQQNVSAEEVHDFVWLFEYGLEMDPAMLNSPDRLDGLALLYGPAVLKGYTIKLGTTPLNTKDGGAQTLVTIVPENSPEAEVWGVLYRVPHRLIERFGQKPALLDTIHRSAHPQSLFQRGQVIVHEMYRDRDIGCVMYAISDEARALISLVPTEQSSDTLLVQRLMALTRKQQSTNRCTSVPVSQNRIAFIHHQNSQPGSAYAAPATTMRTEMHTDALPAFKGKTTVTPMNTALPETPLAATPVTVPPVPITTLPPIQQSRMLIAFAIYLVCMLVVTLAFAVLQGLGYTNGVLGDTFAPLGVPWLVMMFGLLGGCLSSIACLAHYRHLSPPRYVIITWFTRPFIGAVLAGLAYLLLTSGIFAMGQPSSGQHLTLYLLAGGVAGLCEGVFFFRYPTS